MHIDSTSDPADDRWLTLRTEFVPEISVEVQREFLRKSSLAKSITISI